jgi:5-methylcytosine-specific restriction endonuclease McrA
MCRNLIRIGIFKIDQVLPYVFSKSKRHSLRENGFNYRSKEWIEACIKDYTIVIDNNEKTISVKMGSHRYQTFLLKGIKCMSCGVEGKYFALERGIYDNPNRFHFNLYGLDDHNKEVLLTKDHIVPRSKGGSNRLSNYQTMCSNCNSRKADKC